MDKYGLIGYPLKHSFSKDYFNEKFKSEVIDAEYVNFEISSIKELKEIIKHHPNLQGLNVTIPYKEQVIPFLDDLSSNAKEIGAVNVIKFIRKKGKLKLVGYNSDIIGFKQSIEPLLNEFHKKALILGTGGSSKAIYHGFRRWLHRCESVRSQFGGRAHNLALHARRTRASAGRIKTLMLDRWPGCCRDHPIREV